MDSWTATAAQKPGARISAVLNRSDVQWPYARAIDTGISTLQGDTVSFGTNVLNYLNTVAQSDLGMIYCSRDGVFTFRDRYAALNATASVDFGRSSDAYLTLPGSAGAYATVPDSAALDLTGSLEIVARVAMTDWNTPVNQRIVSKLNGASTAAGGGYELYVSNSGTLVFQYSDGAAATNLVGSPLGFTNGLTYWVRVTFDLTTSTAVFYYAGDQAAEPTTWSSAGSASGTGGPAANAIAVTVGGMTGLSREFAGNMYRVAVRNATGASPVTVLDVDFTRGITSTSTTTFAEYSSNAATVTISGCTAVPAVSGVPFSAIETNYGSELLFNRIGVQSAGFGGVTVIQLASQLIYGISSYTTPTLLLNSSTQMLDLGNYLGGVYDSPEYRVQSLQIEVQGLTDAHQAQVLALDMSSIVKVGFTPNGVGTPIYRTCMVVGRNDEMGRGRHLMTLYLADVDRRSFFKLDDTVFGKLDTSVLAF
jgi:hypothetical protein